MPGESVTPEELASAREAGKAAAARTADTAPSHPLLAIGWAQGFGQTDQLQRAVEHARAAGFTWKQIAATTGEHWETAKTKYGGGRERQRAYRKRQRSEGSDS